MKFWGNWRKRGKELDKEIQHHLRMAETDWVERGVSQREAEAGARREFGNVGLAKELTRDAWGWRWLENLFEDLRYGIRTLRKQSGFAIIAILTLALGIGANSAIFSLVDAAFLRAIPVRDAGQLVLLRWKARVSPKHLSNSSYGDCESDFQPTGAFGCSLSEPFFREVLKSRDVFSSVAAFAGSQPLNVSGNGAANVVDQAEYVSGGYFETLGIQPALGRLINREDDAASAGPVVVLSYRYWQSQFAKSRDVLGKTILLNRIPFTIVGVAEEKFASLSPGNRFVMWIPLSMAARLEVPWSNREIRSTYWWLVIVGRRKPEVPVERARAELNTLFRNETEKRDDGQAMLGPEDGGALEVVPIEKGLTGARTGLQAPIYILMAAVGIVLLIACANVAGLMLARSASRQREMALRFALGASKGRILRQLMTESLMLASVGSLAGILLASWCVGAIQNFVAADAEGLFPFTATIDLRVLLFTATITVVTGVLFGLAPAARGMRVDLTPALKEASGSSRQTSRARRAWFSAGNSLVIVQVALSIVVLACAGLLVRTLQNLEKVNPGFDARNLLTFRLDPTLLGYQTSDIGRLYNDVQQRLMNMPGVTSVSYAWSPLLAGNLRGHRFHLEGTPKNERQRADAFPVGPEFFKTMRITLLVGREFNGEDFATAERLEIASEKREAEEAAAKTKAPAGAAARQAPAEDLPPAPAIVNEAFVRKFFPKTNPVGRIFGTAEADPANDVEKSAGWQIAGIVSDAKNNELRREVQPTIYEASVGEPVSFEVRAQSDPLKYVPQIRALVGQMDRNLPVFEIETETRQIEQQLFQERFVARLSGAFGALALLLACIGLYGLVSYEVARRTREIGIRSALGAARGDVLRLVLAQGMRLAFVGAAAGLTLAFFLTRYAKALLFGVTAGDPWTFGFVTMLLIGVTLLACSIPARRAMRVDPVVALRYE
ncbi:MAG TPA: ABC transporter permease [Candidatus Methylomirabilis sp.]|nr:ABC transporter permease [Candidatus Methylomirabilis sp.]